MFIFDSVLSEINIYEINFLNTVVRGMNVCRKCQGQIAFRSYWPAKLYFMPSRIQWINISCVLIYHCAAKVTLFTLELEWNIVRQII